MKVIIICLYIHYYFFREIQFHEILKLKKIAVCLQYSYLLFLGEFDEEEEEEMA